MVNVPEKSRQVQVPKSKKSPEEYVLNCRFRVQGEVSQVKCPNLRCARAYSHLLGKVPKTQQKLTIFVGVRQCALARVWCMSWRPVNPACFAWHAWDNVHCQEVGCMSCFSGSTSFAWQVGKMCTGKESDVRPPWPSSGPSFLRNRRAAIFTAKGLGLCLGVPWAPHFLLDKNKKCALLLAFAWQK